MHYRTMFAIFEISDPQTYQKFGRNQAIFDLMIVSMKDQSKNLIIQLVLCKRDLVVQRSIFIPDSVNVDQTSHGQWNSVSNAFSKLDGLLPILAGQ